MVTYFLTKADALYGDCALHILHIYSTYSTYILQNAKANLKKTFWHKAAKLEGGDHENGSRCPLKNILLTPFLQPFSWCTVCSAMKLFEIPEC